MVVAYPHVLISEYAYDFGIRTADAIFDPVKSRDTQQRLVDDRRALLRLCLDQLSGAMSPPESEPQRITAHAVWRNQVRVAPIGIDLDRPLNPS